MWKRSSIALMLLALAACKTTGTEPSANGAVSLGKAEVMSHIAGNTETWTKGGGYYSPDGQLNVLWNGKETVGTWEVSEDGEVCYVVDVWGSDEECHRYVNDGGETKLLYDGKARVAKIQPGNQLGSL